MVPFVASRKFKSLPCVICVSLKTRANPCLSTVAMIVFSDLNAPVFQKALDAHTFRQRLLKFSSNREAVGVFGELVRADG